MNKILKFPEGFLWGSATSAYQVEGGIENDWWVWGHRNRKNPVAVLTKKISIPKAGRACDHYNRYEEDFDLLKSLNQNTYRFSIEWSRIEPEEGKFNLKELEHYKEMIRALRVRNIVPFVTLHHYTNPIWFSKKGSWLNKKSPDYFQRYVEFIIKNIKDVDFWITLNEPDLYASWYPPLQRAYSGSKWPNFIDTLKTVRNLVIANKKAYHVLHEFGSKNTQVGLAHNNFYFNGHPKIVVNFARWLWNDLFIIKLVKNYQDFIGLNYYFPVRIKIGFTNPKSWFNQNDKKNVSDMGWEICPEGIYHVLKGLAKYKKPIYITENGLADAKDEKRAKFIKDHLYWVHKAIEDGLDVRGYLHWSLMDNFEWDKGFWPRFGLVNIDYKNLERKIRPSAFYYAEICSKNQLIIN